MPLTKIKVQTEFASLKKMLQLPLDAFVISCWDDGKSLFVEYVTNKKKAVGV